jgi:transposase InsO family protein
MRSMKSEYTRRIIMPLRSRDVRAELSLYVTWYNQYRPHQGLAGRTPQELLDLSSSEVVTENSTRNATLPTMVLTLLRMKGR